MGHNTAVFSNYKNLPGVTEAPGSRATENRCAALAPQAMAGVPYGVAGGSAPPNSIVKEFLNKL